MFLHKLSYLIVFSLAEIALFGAFVVAAAVHYSRQVIQSARQITKKGKEL